MRLGILRKFYLLAFILTLIACHSEKVGSAEKSSSPGYWFQLLLIVIPLFIIMIKGLWNLGEIKDSLLSLGSQSRRIISRLEDLEERVKVLQEGNQKKPSKDREE